MHCKAYLKDKVLIITYDMMYVCISNVSSPAMTYGKTSESKACAQYEAQFGVSVTATGLTLDTECPFLGATADGIVNDNVIEIKCPYSGRDKTVSELVQTGYPHLKLGDDGKLMLKEKSTIYSQVQGEMAMKKLDMCHLVVWTPQDMEVINVKFDGHFWNEQLLPKLKLFYKDNICPKYVG
jgi:hypothetical protein